MNEQLLHLDISKRPDASQTVRIGQGDVHGTTVVAEIFDNDVALDLSGKTARFLMRQPGGHNYVRDTNCTVSGNRVTYVVDESHVGTAAGYTDTAYFEILSGSTTIASTQRFRIEVLRHAMDGATPAQSWDTEIDELIQRGEQAVSDANQALADANASIQIAHEAGVEAAEEAASEVEGRVQAAIEAMGDISELAVPEMSADVRGGAKLEQHGGLALRDGALGIGSLVQESDGYARGGLAEVTAKGHAEQDGTPTPDSPVPIQVVRGRNLAHEYVLQSGREDPVYGTVTTTETGFRYVGGNSSNINGVFIDEMLHANNDYVLMYDSNSAISNVRLYTDKAATEQLSIIPTSGSSFKPNKDCYIRFWVSGTFVDVTHVQLTLGSTPQPYVPYGHVGMEARDPDTDELISCTALPLPQRGWVAGLPDGTADSLRLDGAGKCEWELADAETTTAATDGVTGTIGVDVLSTTGQIADGATVLYKLATPVTEDCGYVDDWPTDLPEGCVVSCPELDALGVKYFIDSAVTELARQWYARANSEYEDRLQALEEAMATIITGS